MSKKPLMVAYVSGTRADFGLMQPVLQAIQQTSGLRLRVYATGMHLMKKFGSTINEVRRHYPGVIRLPAIISTDDRAGLALFYGNLCRRLVNEFKKNPPDFVLVLGDRAEMLAVASVCLYLGIPTGHVHGGEKSGTVDGLARHAITKLSSLHFPATKQSAARISRMGEAAWRIYTVGAPGLDVVRQQRLLSGQQLRKKLGLPSRQPLLLVTLHPISEHWQQAAAQMRDVLVAASAWAGIIVIIYPNADAGGQAMIREIEKYRRHRGFHIFPSVDYPTFLALQREAVVWVGNSSAGMIESSTWPTPVVNVGPRQRGREHGRNVIDAPYDRRTIIRAIHRALHDRQWRETMQRSTNPWGDGRSGKRIAKILRHLPPTDRLLSKDLTYV